MELESRFPDHHWHAAVKGAPSKEPMPRRSRPCSSRKKSAMSASWLQQRAMMACLPQNEEEGEEASCHPEEVAVASGSAPDLIRSRRWMMKAPSPAAA